MGFQSSDLGHREYLLYRQGSFEPLPYSDLPYSIECASFISYGSENGLSLVASRVVAMEGGNDSRPLYQVLLAIRGELPAQVCTIFAPTLIDLILLLRLLIPLFDQKSQRVGVGTDLYVDILKRDKTRNGDTE